MGKWFWRKGSQGLGLKPGQWVEIHSCCWLYFYKQTDYQIWYLCRPFQWNNLQKFKYSEGGGGACWSFKLTIEYFWGTQGQ